MHRSKAIRSCNRATKRGPGLVGLATVAAFAALVLPSSAFAQQGVLTESLFNNASGALTDLYQPVFFYKAAPSTNYFQKAEFTNGSTDTAGSQVSVDGLATNSNGSLSAILIFKVTASATKTSALGGDACNTTSTYSQCYTGITIPAGFQSYDLRLTRVFLDSSTGNYWWNAALVGGGTQVNAGLIEVPGGTTTVDPSFDVFDQVQYIGPPTTCALTPQSNVSFFEPFQGSSYGSYSGSLAASGTCNTTFTPLNLGGSTTGVNVLAPSS